MRDSRIRIKTISHLKEVDKSAWNAIANPQGALYDPFLDWDFLESLESSGVVAAQTGWRPCHLLAEDDTGPAAIMPLYIKAHSFGEFVFDHAWAEALIRAGGHYYPKLLSGIPFTPVTGRRIAVRAGADKIGLQKALASAATGLMQDNDLSSLHINFLTQDEADMLRTDGFLIRTGQQYHWINKGYDSFDAFLMELSSAKRKTLRKERRKAQMGLTFKHITGEAINTWHWDAFFAFYIDTSSRKWGYPYLNRQTFTLLGQRMARHIMLVFAMEGDKPIAGALNFIGGDTLYGRYWGCLDARPFLHFETCYYQAIDYAIKHGLKTVEAGAQGEHKLARGYRPQKTYSAHQIAHPGLSRAVRAYLEDEQAAIDDEAEYLKDRLPFRKNR